MKRNRLLVVEDDPATLASIRDLLLRAGFEVETATTGRDALAHLLDNELPSAIILDARSADAFTDRGCTGSLPITASTVSTTVASRKGGRPRGRGVTEESVS